jgi:Domain of unknown function (DUF4347)/Bacterial Ig domain
MPHSHSHTGIGQRPLVEPLEPRLLFSATADISLFEDSISDNELLSKEASETDLLSIYDLPDSDSDDQTPNAADISTLSSDTETPSRELVFVDTGVEGYQQLVDDITQQNDDTQNTTSRQIDIILLDESSNGIQQITDSLNSSTSISAIHIISHGSNGSLQLGNTALDGNSLQQHSEALQSWQHALTDDADLMIYGCNLASDQQGENLITQLSQLTGADIAASNDITANLDNNGDWDLEYHHGQIDTAVVVSEQGQQNWSGSLATETLRDEFSSGFSSNDGTQNWTGDWVESDSGVGAQGNIRIIGSMLQVMANSDDDHIVRQANLSSATTATLTYDVNNLDLSDNDGVRVEISADGGSNWTTLADYNDGNRGIRSESFDISAYTSSNTQIRVYVGEGDEGGLVMFDNLQIEYETAAANNPPTAADNTLTIDEDNDHTFLASDFGYSDADSDPMESITITDLESAGDLTLNGSHVAQFQVISKADIDAGLLKFSPANHEHGNSYDSFQFTVNDGNGDSVTPNTITFDVNAINDDPTGAVAISGSLIEDQTLLASNTLGDNDGLGSITYQWQRDGSDISGANTVDYTLGDDDVGAMISVIARYTDDDGSNESVSSSSLGPVANINDDPTGAVAISGSLIEDQTLHASNTLGDDDGLGSITYQWQRDGSDISGANTADYTLGDADVGAMISVIARYTDAHGTNESMSSSSLGPIANINDAPTTTGLPNVSVNEDAPNEQLDLFAAFDDMEDDDSDLSFALISNTNPGLLNIASIDHGAGTLTLDFAANQFGNSTVTVRATDSDGASVDTSFAIAINAVNDAPTSSGLSDIVTPEGTNHSQINLASVFSDTEPGPLNYTVENNTNPSIISSTTINGSGLLRLEYAPDEAGQTTITVRATDPEGDWIESSFNVEITPLPAPDPDPVIPDPVIPDPEPVLADPILPDPGLPDPVIPDPVQESPAEPAVNFESANEEPDSDNSPTINSPANENTDSNSDEQEFQSTAEQETEQQQSQSLEHTETGTEEKSLDEAEFTSEPLLASISSPELTNLEVTSETNTNAASQIYTPPPLQGIGTNLAPVANADALPEFESLDTSDDNIFYVDHNDPESEIYQELRSQANETLLFSQLPAPAFGINPAQFNQDLESHFTQARNDMAEAFTTEYANSDTIRGLAITVTSGVMIWALRASSLILALVSTTPAWKGLDPLPVLAASRQKRINEKIKQYKDKLSEDTDDSEVGHLFDYLAKSRKPNE